MLHKPKSVRPQTWNDSLHNGPHGKRSQGLLWLGVGLIVSSFCVHGCHAQHLVEPNQVLVPVHTDLTRARPVLVLQGYFKGDGYLDVSDLTFTTAGTAAALPTAASTPIDVAVAKVPADVCPAAPKSWDDILHVCPPTAWRPHLGLGQAPPPDSSTSASAEGWVWCSSPSLLIDDRVVNAKESVRHVEVSTSTRSPVPSRIQPSIDAQFTIDEQGGFVVIVVASCDTINSQPVAVNGTVRFVSFAEEIQEIVNEEVPFYGVTSIAYMVLFFWFAYLMHEHAESRIDLEEWIFGTIAIGFGQSLLRFLEFILWRRSGHRNAFVALLAAIAYGAKHGVSRGLLVVLSSGVGVTQAHLDRTPQVALWILTSSYVVLSTLVEYVDYVEQAQEKGQLESASGPPGGFLLDVEAYLLTAMLWIDFIFVLWIPTALRSTMVHLRLTNQERKLERFRSLVRILCAAVSLSILAMVLFVLDIVYDGGRFALRFDLGDVGEFNVYLILLLVAILWRPNPMAREYAYVMEAPTEEGGGHDLELVETSAAMREDSGSSPSADSNYKSFPIDSAEAT